MAITIQPLVAQQYVAQVVGDLVLAMNPHQAPFRNLCSWFDGLIRSSSDPSLRERSVKEFIGALSLDGLPNKCVPLFRRLGGYEFLNRVVKKAHNITPLNGSGPTGAQNYPRRYADDYVDSAIDTLYTELPEQELEMLFSRMAALIAADSDKFAVANMFIDALPYYAANEIREKLALPKVA